MKYIYIPVFSNAPNQNGDIFPQKYIEEVERFTAHVIRESAQNIIGENILDITYFKQKVEDILIKTLVPDWSSLSNCITIEKTKPPDIFVPKITICEHKFIPMFTSVCCVKCGIDKRDFEEKKSEYICC